MLTAREIEALLPQAKSYRVQDSRNLFIRVDPSGAKYWVANVFVRGKRSSKSLGRWPGVSALEARRRLVAVDQVADSRLAGLTLQALAERWHGVKASRLTSDKYAQQILARLDADVYPSLGQVDVAEVSRRQLIDVVSGVAGRGAVETAHRIAQYLGQMFDYAVDIGVLDSHPASHLVRVLPATQKSHHAALSPQDSGPLYHALWSYNGSIVIATALRVLAFCVPRAQELAGMRWKELQGDVWLIPAERMKRDRPHVVPLSSHVRAELERLRLVTGQGEFVFASGRRHGHMHPETPAKAIRDLGFKGLQTEHGMRSIFSTAANECGLWSYDAIERQLAHDESDKIRAAYHRAEYLDERRRLMQWWADWIVAKLGE